MVDDDTSASDADESKTGQAGGEALDVLRQFLESQPPERVPQLLGEKITAQVVQQVAQYSEEYAGPLPHPSHLEQFERTVPGSGDRILTMAEQQSAHRQDLEHTMVHGGAKRANWGLGLGFVVAMTALVFGFILILSDRSGVGLAIILVEIATLAGVFVYGRHSQSRERIRKAQPDSSPRA